MDSLTNLVLPNEIFFGISQEILQSKQKIRIVLKGDSMKPVLRDGDILTLKRLGKQNLFLGDIVLAIWNDKFVLHRIVLIKKNTVFLAGDNNLIQIEKVNRQNVLAKVYQYSRAGKGFKELSAFHKMLGLFWFACRPFRIAIKRLFKN